MNDQNNNRNFIKGTAILLCIVFPGVGQIYLGQYKKGILFYLIALFIVTFPFIWIISLIDIILDKKGISAQAENPFSKRKTVLIISILTAPFSLFHLSLLAQVAFSHINDEMLAQGRTEKEISQIEKSVMAFEQHYGRYPDSINELIAIKPIREGWKWDNWKQSYYYAANDTGFVLISPGRDGKLFTEDDIRRDGN